MQRLKMLMLVLLSVILLVSAFSCAGPDDENEGISVIATLFPQYDFARAILGEKGNAVLLLPPGADSHNFELTVSDMRRINSSDIFIYTGPGMEIWVDGIIDSINSDVDIINLSETIEIFEHEAHGHPHDNTDPHIWTSPKNAMFMLEAVYNSICSADAVNKEYYTVNYNRYLDELTSLDIEFSEISKNAKNKKLYFSGKFAFHYFVEEYGLSYAAPFNSCSDVQIESLKAINDLITEIKSNDVSFVFYEELSQSAVLDTIVQQTGVTPLLLHSVHNVSKNEFENGATYISLMKGNVTNLRKALTNG